MPTFYKTEVRKLPFRAIRYAFPSLGQLLIMGVVKILQLPGGGYYYHSNCRVDEHAVIPETAVTPVLVQFARTLPGSHPDFGWRRMDYYNMPTLLAPLHRAQAVSFLSGDGLLGLLASWQQVQGKEFWSYSCTTPLAPSGFLITYSHSAFNLFRDKPPSWDVAAASEPTVAATLASHRRRMQGKATVSMRPETVASVVRALSHEYFDFNLERGFLIPATVDEIRQVRRRQGLD
jgi:hypothetical protein